MTAAAERDGEQEEMRLSGIRKAAILLVTVGELTSSAILKHFSEDEVDRKSTRLNSSH